NYGNYSLRTKGAAEATVTRYASQGIDSRINQTMHVDYFKVYQLSPEIYFEQLQHTVVLTLNNTLELDFEFGKGLETTYHFTADIETGWTALDHILTFTNPGLYTFTLHAQNAFGIQTKTFEVDVQLGDTNPVITLNENEASIDLSSSTNTYELNYSTNVTNPISTLSIDVDQLTGYTLEGNQLSFSQIGIYIVTLSYSNENSTDTKIVTITVTKTEPESYIYIDNFDTLPTTLTLTGDATANIEDGQLVLQTYATSAKAHFGGTFDQALVGTYAAETRVKLTGTSFLNLILLYSGTSNVLGVAVQDGTLRYQNGTAWINSEIAVPQDEFFTLKVITTVMSGTFDIYV
ncbi:hypothetical protein, partial [Acholeplasma granularum]|uniref:hypothetical protein n=1 Tax=Acholeplasma granularum TaxID=264635 RepID=UPI000558B8B0